MRISMDKVKVHFLHESGMTFIEIAKVLGGTAKEMAKAWVDVERAKAKFKAKEKIVYRKRLNNKKVKK
ncbi:DNA primase-helicase subunit [Yersinia phage vB_YenM_P8]